MNLEKIKEIVGGGSPAWQTLLLKEIATDQNAIAHVLTMLNEERHQNKELITELNFQLSRAHIALESPKVNKDGFVQKEITKFYEAGKINHCYKQSEQ